MRSAPTEAAIRGVGGAEPGSAASPSLDIRPQSWIKRALPRTMFGRSLLLIVMPLVLVQMIAAWVFYTRHWETVSYRFSSDVAGDIGMVIEAMKAAPDPAALRRLFDTSAGLTDMSFALDPGATL